ncbi:amino acid adenylation domain-containing protein [Pseudoalteromonas maricaloris]|uniref:amino acid adenylation domain-containing protein n=1 Tax=Pseudoalteromonas maricaloris TaxID=184924 RepID=UPI003C21C626
MKIVMDVKHSFDLTITQKDIYFDQLRRPNSPLYNVGGYIRIGKLCPKKLIQAHATLIECEDIFGLRIKMEAEGPCQYVSSKRTTSLLTLDFTAEQNPEESAKQWLRTLFETPLDIEEEELFRAALIKLAEENYWYVGFAHHLIMDGWGFSNWARKLGDIYNDESTFRSSENDWEAIVEKDVSYLNSRRFNEDKEFWSSNQSIKADRLLTAHYQSDCQRSKSQRQILSLDSELFVNLNRFANGHSVTPATVFLSLVAAYFSQAYSKEKLVFGIPAHNRKNHQQKKMLGVFTSISPLGLEVEPKQTFSDLLEQVSRRQKHNFRHQRYPIGQIMNDLDMLGNKHSLYDVCFNYLKLDSQLSFEGQHADLVFESHNHEATPMMLTVWEYGESDSCEIQFDYNLAYFNHKEITELGERLCFYLNGLMAQPDVAMEQVRLLPAKEYQQLTHQKVEHVEHNTDRLIWEYFSEQANRTPENVALICGEQQIIYRDLEKRSNQLAHLLREKGVKVEELVAVAMERSVETVIAILAIMKSGAAYVPIDPSYPAARIKYMLDDSNVNLILTQTGCRLSIDIEEDVEILELDDEALIRQLDAYPVELPNRLKEHNASNLAYVIYTSGSTGNPKGVMGEHGAMLNRFHWMWNTYPIQSEDIFCSKTVLGFVDSIWEMFGGLLKGCKTVLLDIDTVKNVPLFMERLAQHKVTRLVVVPSLLGAMMQDESRFKQCLNSLTHITVSGEVLLSSLRETFLSFDSQCELLNLYGSSETAADATYCRVTDENYLKGSIGYPIDNMRCYILDDKKEPVPTGIVGSLYISGPGLARGYLNNEEATQERFIENAFSADSEQRMFNTGDLARYLPNGSLEFIGRADDQVKIRGHRLEPGEIQRQLDDCNGVERSFVLAKEAAAGELQLVAYIVMPELEQLSDKDQQDFILNTKSDLAAHLPAYMVPDCFVLIKSLPLMTNGKIDRSALPEPNLMAIQPTYTAPTTDTEKQLVGIWSELLQLPVDNMGTGVNFFAIGGNSLNSVRLISEIRSHMGCEITVKEVFDAPTIAQLARIIETSDKTAVDSIFAVDRSEPIAASFSQHRLWVIDQLEGGSSNYNLTSALKIKGQFDLDAAERAFEKIIQRHEPLRTMFSGDSDEVWQNIADNVDFSISIIDIQTLNPEKHPKMIQELIRTESQKPFDLQHDIKLRAAFVRLDDAEGVLIVTMHHIASDGWSMEVLKGEFSQYYGAILTGKPSNISDLLVHYADYAQWQKQWLQEDKLDNLLGYWQGRLAGAPQVHKLPIDKPRPENPTYEGKICRQQLDSATSKQLNGLAQAHGCTLFCVLQAAYSILLGRYSGESDIVIGSAIANRERKELGDLVGYFANTLVLRSDVAGNPRFIELLSTIQQNTLNDISHQQLPFEVLVESLNPTRHRNINPLFQVVLNLGIQEQQKLALPNASVELLENENVVSNFDLTLQAIESENGLLLEWRYATELFNPSSIESLAQSFEILLKAVVEEPKTYIDDLPILSHSDREKLLHSNAQVFGSSKEVGLLHELFEQHANCSPEETALVFEDESITYGQLESRANQLSHCLIKQGVKPDTLVGLCVDRSIEMVVGILGILKAGGAYVPLDPGYPDERLSCLFDDSKVEIVVTQPHLQSLLPAGGIHLLALDFSGPELQEQPTHAPIADEIGLEPTNLAYMIYTSGSSGQPKGVLVEHRQIADKVAVIAERYELTADDKMLLFASISFDASVTQLFAPLSVGGTVVVRPADITEPVEFMDYLCQHKVSLLHVVPQYLRLLLEDEMLPWEETQLRTMICGGDKLSRALVEQWHSTEFGREIKLFNSYGPTETTVTASVFEYTGDDFVESLPIGGALDNTRFYVVDEQLQLLPPGAVGELLIGGSAVARGYHNNKGLTEEKFISLSFGTSAERVYRTGDLVRMLPSGELEFIGRRDHQVKVRGFRIELGEIEAQLSACEGVANCAVLFKENQAGEQSLHAYVVLSSSTLSAVENDMQRQLPEYMLPSRYTELDELPVTVSGKLDRKALELSSEIMSSGPVAPRSDVEETLLEIWHELLDVEVIGVTDNFFQCGGHSLLATRLITKIRAAFDVEFTLKSLFEAPSIEEQAQVISYLREAQKVSGLEEQHEEVADEFVL